MGRVTGWVLAMGLVAVAGQSARAQMPAAVNGGFGVEYTQTIPANSLMLDRWWMLEATPRMGSVPPQSATVVQPAAMQPVAPARGARAHRSGRSFARGGSRPVTSAVVQPVAPLPMGSLYWPQAIGMPLYSPSQRYASYGYGYGVSPYGTAYYGAYKGY
jgi:hypothetical protein